MAKKLKTFVIFKADPKYYHIRRNGDVTKTTCNKKLFGDETLITRKPKRLKVCDMCRSILKTFRNHNKWREERRRNA